MKQLAKRLRSKAGETLIEAMVSILIFTLASIIMFTMISAAADINQKSKDVISALQNELAAVEKAQSGGSLEKVFITFGTHQEQVNVMSYGGEGKLQAYYIDINTTE